MSAWRKTGTLSAVGVTAELFMMELEPEDDRVETIYHASISKAGATSDNMMGARNALADRLETMIRQLRGL